MLCENVKQILKFRHKNVHVGDCMENREEILSLLNEKDTRICENLKHTIK